MLIEALAFFAAAAAADAPAAQGEQRAALAVGATVIRPAEISADVGSGDRGLLTVTESGELVIAAEQGRVTRIEGDRWLVIPAGRDPVIVTLLY